MENLTDAQKYQRKKEQDAERQKRYYAANKEVIAERRKKDRALVKQLKAMTLDQVPPAAAPAAAAAAAPAAAPAAEPTPAAGKNPVEASYRLTNQVGKTFRVIRKLPEEKIIEFIQLSDAGQASKNTNINNVKQIFRITQCDDFRKCLLSEKLIKAIDQGKKNNGEDYSTNSKKGMFQTILTIMDTLPGLKKLIPNEIQKPYREKFQYYKDLSNDDREKGIKNLVVPLWSNYLKAILDKYGESSKQYLIAKIYHEMPVRDDLQLKIVKTEEEANNKKVNYIIIPKNASESVKAINNVYKTAAQYGTLLYTFSPELSKLVRDFVKPGSKTLFTGKTLSKYVGDMSRKVGMNVTINTMRKMTETEAKDLSFDDRSALARKLGHSPATALASYVGSSSK